MVNIANIVYHLLNVGLKLTLSTGAVFNPAFQVRECAIQDLAQQQSAYYEANYEYSTTEWTDTFILKEIHNKGE